MPLVNGCRRAPSTIYELDELDQQSGEFPAAHAEEQETEELIHFSPAQAQQQPPPSRFHQLQRNINGGSHLETRIHTGRDEGDGPGRLSDSPDPAEPLPPKKSRGQSRSFETLILNLINTVRTKIRLYLADYSGLDFLPVGGYRCLTAEMVESVIHQKHVNAVEGRAALSVWFMDGRHQLDVQLKPLHNPFAIQHLWKYYLTRYADQRLSVFDSHVPIVHVRRNLWLTLEAEQQLTDATLLRLLFHEAKEHFVAARYIFDHADIVTLLSLLLYQQHGRFALSPRNNLAVRNSLQSFSPRGFLPQTLFSFSRSPRRDAIVDAVLADYQSVVARSPEEIMSRFLLICRGSPLYGSAYFPAQVESCSFLSSSARLAVSVAVNERGLYLLTTDTRTYPEMLLELTYDQFDADHFEPSEESQEEPFIVLTLHDDQRLLPIFGKQASLMVACVDSFRQLTRTTAMRRLERQIDGDSVELVEEKVSEGGGRHRHSAPAVAVDSRLLDEHRHIVNDKLKFYALNE